MQCDSLFACSLVSLYISLILRHLSKIIECNFITYAIHPFFFSNPSLICIVGSTPNEFIIIVFCYERAGLVAVTKYWIGGRDKVLGN